MPNPTRQEIIDAHEALAELRALVESNPPRRDTDAEKLEGRIFTALPPLPRPTMADVEWDDDEHYMAEAELGNGITVTMLIERGDFISCIQPPNGGDVAIGIPKEDLTPTGKRYTLTEVQE